MKTLVLLFCFELDADIWPDYRIKKGLNKAQKRVGFEEMPGFFLRCQVLKTLTKTYYKWSKLKVIAKISWEIKK